jgi:hypothetical protein
MYVSSIRVKGACGALPRRKRPEAEQLHGGASGQRMRDRPKPRINGFTGGAMAVAGASRNGIDEFLFDRVQPHSSHSRHDD